VPTQHGAFFVAIQRAKPCARSHKHGHTTRLGQDEDIECIHPLGDRLVGIAAVSESWRQILSRGKRMQFQLRRSNRFQNEQLAIHSLYENISIGGKSQPPVVTVNIYRFNGSGWHMILHHASPATSIKGKSGKQVAGADRTIH
jgi:hypothetical protein